MPKNGKKENVDLNMSEIFYFIKQTAWHNEEKLLKIPKEKIGITGLRHEICQALSSVAGLSRAKHMRYSNPMSSVIYGLYALEIYTL